MAFIRAIRYAGIIFCFIYNPAFAIALDLLANFLRRQFFKKEASSIPTDELAEKAKKVPMLLFVGIVGLLGVAVGVIFLILFLCGIVSATSPWMYAAYLVKILPFILLKVIKPPKQKK